MRAQMAEAAAKAAEDKRLVLLRLSNLDKDVAAGTLLSGEARKKAEFERGQGDRSMTSDATARGAITSQGFGQGLNDLGTQFQASLTNINTAEQDRNRREAEERLRLEIERDRVQREQVQRYLMGVAASRGGGGGGYGGGSSGAVYRPSPTPFYAPKPAPAFKPPASSGGGTRLFR